MRILLDTHVLLWALGEPNKLSLAVRKQIDETDVYVSAASIWEIGIKSALGKLTATASAILAATEPAGFKLLSITVNTQQKRPIFRRSTKIRSIEFWSHKRCSSPWYSSPTTRRFRDTVRS